MADARDERRVVTALFADVAGSTPLSERLDPEEAKLVIGEAITRAIQAVEAYGGTINNLLGDGLLGLFGAPVAHEDDAERAVRAGLDIIAAMRDYGEEVRRGWGVEGFAMRVGIHTGEVVVGQVGAGGRVEYGVVGDTVNTTARLQGAADSNGVLVSERTQRQVRDQFHWGEPRSLQLKGKSETVTAYPVVQPTETSARAAMQASAAPMVGREAELSSALELLQLLDAGRGGVLFIVGEPGIGKSRMAAELRQRATEEQGRVWMEGRCVSYGEALPYWPYRDLLRNWLDVSPTDSELRVRVKLRRKTDEAFEGQGAEAYPYLATILGLTLEPDVAAQLKPLSPESIQYRTFEVFGELLQRIAARGPVVLSLDDLHWADPTSLALTERLLPLTEGGPILLAISQRPETDHPSWLLKEKAAREYRHLFRELALHPLGHDSETQLLGALTHGRKLPPAVAERLLGYAEGNPFYLEQILHSLVDSGTLIPENGHWKLRAGETLAIPQTLEGVIIARIDRLEPLWRTVLTSASILGRSFGLNLLQAVTGLAMPEVRQAVHHLLRLDLFREEGGAVPTYRFKHALIQEAAFHTLVGATRAALHRRAAVWYETFYADRLDRVYGLIAHHWLGTDDHAKAAHFLKLAGDRALAEWSLDEAIGHYRALIPLLDEAERREEAAETLFELASSLHLAMRYREANETWQRAFREWSLPVEKPTAPTASLTIGTPTVPWETDPVQGLHSSNISLHRQLYDTLLNGRPGPYVVPNLAIRWEVSDDGRRYRFELDPKARLNDGSPIRALDVVEGFRNLLDPRVRSTEAAHVSPLENAAAYAAGKIDDFDLVGVHTVDETTVEFRLHAPAPYWMFLLVYPAQSGARAGQTNGAFQLERLDGDRVIVRRDPRHDDRGSRGNIAIVEWKTVRTREEGLDGLLRGEIDLVTPIHLTPDADAAIADGRISCQSWTPLMTHYFAFTGIPPYQADVHLRKALAHAIDRTAMASRLFSNQIAAGGGLVPPGLLGHTPHTVLPFDPDLARRHLRQSNHRGAFRISLIPAWINPYWEPLVDGWRQILDLDIQIIELSVHEIPRAPQDAHAALGLWMAGYPDPEYYLHMLLHSRSTSNINRWSSPAFDQLVDQALAQETSAARLALFHEADRLAVQEECSMIPLIYLRVTTLFQPWLHGWWSWGAPWQSYDELSIDERSPRYHGPNEEPRS